jgi:sulfite exporter TauE/SafE
VNLFLPMLGVGLVTSIHCVAMCGPLVLTYAVKGAEEGPWLRRMVPHVAYQGAKIASYVLVGLALGALGSLFDFGGLRGWVTVFAGIFMVLLGLQMTGKFPVLRRLSFRPPKPLMNALGSLRKKANADEAAGHVSLATPLTFGLLTGLMPCGPLQSAQIAAAGTGSALSGGLAMLGFGLGTAPLMLGFGAVSGALSLKFKQRMMVVAAIFIAILGLVMLNRGLMLIGSPVTAQSIKQAVVGSSTAQPGATPQYAVDAEGVAVVEIAIENVRFIPQVVSIPADQPVRLIVDRREENSCSDQLAVPQLGVLVDLKPFATTTVELPAAKAGTYTLTCGMGMMSGSLIVGAAAGTASGAAFPLGAVIAALAIVGLIVALWATSRTSGARLNPREVIVLVVLAVAAVIAGLSLGGMLGT